MSGKGKAFESKKTGACIDFIETSKLKFTAETISKLQTKFQRSRGRLHKKIIINRERALVVVHLIRKSSQIDYKQERRMHLEIK